MAIQTQTPATSPTPRLMPLRAVGRSMPKRDAYEKVTGAARYTGDISLPGMLRARFLHSPFAHARIKRIDTTEAEKLPGVYAVLTHENTPKTKYSDTKTDQLNLLPFPSNLDQVLFDDKVRYAGEPVAAVAAADLETANRALELIEVEYEELAAVFDPLQAMAPDAPRIHDHVQNNMAGYLPFKVGDVEAGFGQADLVVEETFTITSRQKQAQMEPTACIAHWEQSGKVTVWSPTQTPHLNKQKLAALFDIPQSSVRVINPHIGGTFGATLGFTLEPHAVALSRATRRPVRLELTREEMFPNNSSRHPMIITLKVGFTREGQPTAIQVKVIGNTGAYATEGPDVVAATSAHFFRLYPCFNLSFEGITVYTNAPPAGGFRGYGGPQAYFALEQLIDIAAERLGLDPLEMRRRVSVGKGGFDGVLQLPILSCGLQECLEKGSAAIGWTARRGQGRKDPSATKKRGVGMASVMWISGTACLVSTLDSSSAVVTMHEDGSATILSAACDMGTGARTALTQIVADELGLPVERVQIGAVDTEQTPFDTGAHASRTLFMAGNAVRVAAADVREQVLGAAAAQLEVDAADLELDQGTIRVSGVPDQSTTVQAVARGAYLKGRQFIGRADAPQVNEPPFGAQFAEVEVDTETGEVKVLKLVAAHDVGRAINPLIVEGQLEGALAQGLGYAFMEDMPVDPRTGAALTVTLADYRIPTTEWMPETQVILVEDPGPSGPFGAKSCGEMGLGPTAAAIVNAIYDATGVRVRGLPLTPERVLSALKEAT